MKKPAIKRFGMESLIAEIKSSVNGLKSKKDSLGDERVSGRLGKKLFQKASETRKKMKKQTNLKH